MKRNKFQAIVHILSMYASQQATYWDLAKEAKKLWQDENYLIEESQTYEA